jgi:tetratricopeptide (TPR) repeat protein
MREMQQFLSSAPDSSLRLDALEVLVWDGIQMHDSAARRRWSSELLSVSPANPLGRAAIASDQQLASNGNPKRIQDLQVPLSNFSKLHRPEGMIPAEFALLKEQTYVELSGAIGLAYLSQKEYSAAQTYLRPAVSIRPNESRYVYALAIALLQAQNPDTAKGFWYLARAVNLTAGTSDGARIAQFARDSYTRNGGSNADWNQFVAVTSFGTPSKVNAMAAYNGSVARSAPSLRKAPPVIAAAVPTLPSRASSDLHDEAASRPQRRLPPANDPVSLGILIQTSLLKGENREAIVFGLTDLARHLRDNDEAFIMAFSDQLDFQQDLTSQDKLLEEALDEIRPKSGAALLDGVAFAVGHLDRVGKNKNRALFVISDGRNDAHLENGSPPLSWQHGDVRINCIAVNARRGTDPTFLQRLAQYSGGRMSYAADPQQLRVATSQIAQSMGIAFPQ